MLWHTYESPNTGHVNPDIFSLLQYLKNKCAENSLVTGELPSQRPMTRNFHIFFDLRRNKLLSEQLWRRWFETPLRSFWRHCNDPIRLKQQSIDSTTMINAGKRDQYCGCCLPGSLHHKADRSNGKGHAGRWVRFSWEKGLRPPRCGEDIKRKSWSYQRVSAPFTKMNYLWFQHI